MRTCALLLILAFGCGSDDPESAARAENSAGAKQGIEIVALTDEADAALAPDAEPPIRYAATKDGLRTLVEDVTAALAGGDDSRAERIADSLALPDAASWFSQIFGPELGAELAADYQPTAARVGDILAAFQSAQDAGQSNIDIDRFPETSTFATGYQALAFERMKKPVTLYSIRLTVPKAERGLHLWSFAHDGESFRWVGKMKALSDEPPTLVTVTPEGASEPIEVDMLELPVRAVSSFNSN